VDQAASCRRRRRVSRAKRRARSSPDWNRAGGGAPVERTQLEPTLGQGAGEVSPRECEPPRLVSRTGAKVRFGASDALRAPAILIEGALAAGQLETEASF